MLSPLNLLLILRLYDSLASYLLIVPYPIAIKYSTAQILLMMRPTGKPTSLVPGRMNPLTFVAVVDCNPANLALPNTPLTKDASWVDSRVLTGVPSCSVPESVIAGVSSDSAVVLCMAVSNYMEQRTGQHSHILQLCQGSIVNSAHETHAFQPSWWNASRPSDVNIRGLIPLGREPW